jgi:hypothetical protein
LSVTLREEHKLRVFENRLLRKILVFGPMRGEVTVVWRRLHSEDLHGFYFSANIFSDNQIKENEMGVVCSTHGERRGAFRVLVGRSEGKRRVRRPRLRCEDNIKVDLHELGWGRRLG